MTRNLKAEYVKAVTNGVGFMSWQEEGVSDEEVAFRRKIERRKERMLANRIRVKHPVMLTSDEIDTARRNIRKTKWAKKWFQKIKTDADYLVRQADEYVDQMLPELTPWTGYTFFCPNCYGIKTQEGTEYSIIDWDFRNPDHIRCKACGHSYPSKKFPETGKLVCPRSGQTITFYLNDDERKHPDDRSGKYAWHWAHRPVHPCFSGIVRERKIYFILQGSRSLALAYAMTGDARYARRSIQILVKLAQRFGSWLYHDYWDTVADCDPLYAAWHDRELKLEWKRNLFTSAYETDTVDRASMLQGYWGAGRIHPSTGNVGMLVEPCLAYDLVHDAVDEVGRPLWSPELRERVERDLLLEWIIEAEVFVGGTGKTANVSNKAPRIYKAQAAIAKCLGIPEYADNALRGFDAISRESFNADGFSKETPSYNSMYLSDLLWTPELLHGFRWPRTFKKRSGVVDLYKNDPRLRLMLQAQLDEVRPDGRFIPLSDTHNLPNSRPGGHLIEIGLKRFPDLYSGRLPALYGHSHPSEYAVLHLDAKEVERDSGLDVPEILFPNWMTAILRHGDGPGSTILALPFNPAGGHRHYDNLALFYEDRGRTILGDHGYMWEAPMQRWVKSTFSHNLVIVDDEMQLLRTGRLRRPEFHLMGTSPRVSVVEAGSRVYDQCSEYRRLLALFKGPGAETFLLDIFRVKGGKRHDHRIFSELASTDAGKAGSIKFDGLDMPQEESFRNIGASFEEKDLFGLQHTRRDSSPSDAWQATWKEKGRSYRLWMLTPSDSVEASNGPGQGTFDQVGRRVRYLDVIRKGRNVESTFVAIHEPSGRGGSMPVKSVERIQVPKSAGPNAVALRIDSRWGVFYVFNEISREMEIGGVRFKGRFGVFCEDGRGSPWHFSLGAGTLTNGDCGFENQPAEWSGRVTRNSNSSITTSKPRPKGWPELPAGCQNYVRIHDGNYQTGYPLEKTRRGGLEIRRFPLVKAHSFKLHALRFTDGE